MEINIRLTTDQNMFTTGSPVELGNYDGLRVLAGSYDGHGLPYLDVQNSRGMVRILANRGLQVWGAEFDGERLGMDSLVKTPHPKPLDQEVSSDPAIRTRQYLADYGAYSVGCGVTVMGCAGPEDNHPLHGNLPLMGFECPVISWGEDKSGKLVTIAGFSQEGLNGSMDRAYIVKREVTINDKTALIHLATTTYNRGLGDLDFMFLEHINHRKVDGSRVIFYPDLQNLRVREQDPGHISSLSPAEQIAYQALKNAARENPQQFMHVNLGRPIFPELVFYGEQHGDYAIAAQVRADGSADITAYDPRELKQLVIWMRDATEEQAEREGFAVTNSLGLLPATGKPEGYSQAKKDGEVGIVNPDQSRTANIVLGRLNREELLVTIPDLEKRLRA